MSSRLLHLPSDWIHDILSSLPVKDLLRFRSVSISWRSLIDSPIFTESHLSRSQKTRSSLFFLSKDGRTFTMIDFPSLVKVPHLQQPPLQLDSRYPPEIVGSCNGLIALYSSHSHRLSLWNPATRKFHQLPYIEICLPREGFSLTSAAFGIGYDSEKDDYKLVQSIIFKEPSDSPWSNSDSEICEGAVFSVKSYSWKRINCPFHIGIPGISVPSEALVNNAPHWFLSRYTRKIVAFDFVKEEYYIVPVPEFDSEFGFSGHLSVLGGCLSMAILPNNDPCVDVWVMTEYGIKDSWSKLFSWRYPSPSPSGYHLSCVIPVAFSRDGAKVLVKDNRHLSWFDLESKTIEFVEGMDGVLLEYWAPFMCVESLVWPRSRPRRIGDRMIDAKK